VEDYLPDQAVPEIRGIRTACENAQLIAKVCQVILGMELPEQDPHSIVGDGDDDLYIWDVD